VKSLQREEITPADRNKVGVFLWFAMVHLPISSYNLVLAVLTLGLGLLHKEEDVLESGGRTSFSFLSFS
jgi:hypothetical protein